MSSEAEEWAAGAVKGFQANSPGWRSRLEKLLSRAFEEGRIFGENKCAATLERYTEYQEESALDFPDNTMIPGRMDAAKKHSLMFRRRAAGNEH